MRQADVDLEAVIRVIQLMDANRHRIGADARQGRPHTLDLIRAPRHDQVDHGLVGPFEEALFDRFQHHQHRQDQERREDRFEVLRGSGCHPDGGHRPDGRRGRQASHQVLAKEDRPGAQEANARHNLRGNPRRVGLAEAVGADNREQARSQRDHGHRAQPRRPLLTLALQSDEPPCGTLQGATTTTRRLASSLT